MQRMGSVLRVKPEHFEEYKRLHAAVWPAVLEIMRNCNIRNFSIYHKDGWLFSYYEYVGEDYATDMRRLADDAENRRRWSVVGPLQQPLESRLPGEWWAGMEEVFHCG